MVSHNSLIKIHLFFQDRRRLAVTGLLLLVLLLGAFLRFYQLGTSGVGNAYYAATVKSMLTSWHNFFYVAFEPGGSVSVDKPPLGFWLEALSAYALGVNGIALTLPNAIAGVLSIFIVYKLVRRPFGDWAGLLAALALAIMPVAISAERNNTIDGMLVFTLLLAAWAFLQAVYSNRVRWLFVGALIVGLAFNIKMLQAFLPLPAFYAIYFFGMKRKWWRKLLELTAASALLLAVAFSWAIIVDLTPVSQRPYVDSTSNNTVMELIFGHNGIERLTNLRQGLGLDGRTGSASNAPGFAQGNLPQPPAGQGFPQGGFNDGTRPQPPAGEGTNLYDEQFSGRNSASPGSSMDFGTAGTLRLFTQPLVGEASWLLPFVLGGLVLLAIVLLKRPFSDRQLVVLLWAGWLIPETFYFTYSQGLMHAYYLIMMGAPLAALTAATAWAIHALVQRRRLLGWGLGLLLVAGTLAFQTYTLQGTTSYAMAALIAALVLVSLGAALAAASGFRVQLVPAALGLLLAGLFVAPLLWSALTTLNSSPNVALPAAGPSGQNTSLVRLSPGNGAADSPDQNVVTYLLANPSPGGYLVAVEGANEAAPLILETVRPVFTFGGFLGTDNIVDADGLAKLVASGKLRYILDSGQLSRSQPEITTWLQSNCSPVNVAGLNSQSSGFGPRGTGQSTILYDCGD